LALERKIIDDLEEKRKMIHMEMGGCSMLIIQRYIAKQPAPKIRPVANVWGIVKPGREGDFCP
jgi:hypothetical protein